MEEGKVCDICGTYKYTTDAQIRGHKYHCLKNINSDEPKEDKPNVRKERIPFGTPEQKWGPREPDGFHYRVFNDNWKKEPGRVKRAIAAGYEVVEDKRSGTNVGTNDDGSEIKGVLMRIPNEWYKEDQGKKARELDKIDEQIHGGKFDKNLTNTYGSVDINVTKE
jgi:hypothetical protein